jgi:predicted RNA-binding protein with TRAM domain
VIWLADTIFPVRVSQVVKGTVASFGEKGGDPLLFVESFAVFVKAADLQVGDFVKVKIEKVFKRFAFASLIRKIPLENETDHD